MNYNLQISEIKRYQSGGDNKFYECQLICNQLVEVGFYSEQMKYCSFLQVVKLYLSE